MANLAYKVFLVSLFVVSSAFGTFLLEVKGKVLSIENGKAVIKSENDDKIQIILKRLSKGNRRIVMNASGSDKVISIKVTPETFQK
jgi:hypothetical protein